MLKPPAKSINQVLSDDCNSLGKLVERARLLHRLTEVMRSHLPDALRDHCAVSTVQDRTLIVCADSAAWASKLRFHAPTLLPKLRELPALRAVQQLRVKVEPPVIAGDSGFAGRRPLMSESGARAIDGCARSMRDSLLKQALQRLATRGTKTPPRPERGKLKWE